MRCSYLPSAARHGLALLLLILCLFGPLFHLSATSQTPASAPLEDREAVAFVRDLLAQRPATEIAINGIFHIRQPDGRRSQVPVRYSVRLGGREWQSVYATERTSTLGPEELVVTHSADQPNRYQLKQVSLDGARTNLMTLTGSEAVVSFAGSDFWLTDLGLEFLHWPDQRMVRDAKITMRWGRPMKVVESRNPRPAVGGYSRVVSWIDSELGSVVRAEAYDVTGKRFKIFDLKSFKKVDGRWHVKDMEIRNNARDSLTRLEFEFRE
ncbi:MAG: outer membrane lipoprotein-sorting protein [Verrucomicrobiia bacterium]